MAAETNKIVLASDLLLFIKSGATELPIAFSTSCKLDVKLSTREIKTKDNVGDWNEILPDKFSFTLSTDGLMATKLSGTTLGADSLFDMFLNKTVLSFTFALKTGNSPSWTANTSYVQYKGNLLITSYGISGGESGNATFSISADGTSTLSKVNGI